MKALVREAMEHGSLGVSFGLAYAPSCYADTDELIALAKVVAEYHGLISAHIRNEGDHVVRAAEEFLTVVRESGARGVYSHLKSAGKENWGKVCHTLAMIDEMNEAGFEVFADVYPYNASHTRLSATIVPKHLHSGGIPALLKAIQSEEGRREIRAYCESKWQDWNWVQITICKGYPEFEGKRIPEIAASLGMDEIDAMCEIILASHNVCSACYFSIWEQDIERVIAHPRTMICTDSGVAANNKVYHPRLRASFPRALAKYVRERGVVTLPEMIRKMTALPATVYGLTAKGVLREGMDADVCVFDPEKIQDHATFADCRARATGLAFVLVGGEIVVKDATGNGKRAGRVLRYHG
jgi:N-acyl-D-amino-acid deacylase